MDLNYKRLCQIKNEILLLTKEAEDIIKVNYPEQYSVSISFWIPQIVTALEESNKWLPRGDYTMQNTIEKIKYD